MTHIGRSEKVLLMRIFLTVLILIFSFQSWSKADEIKDFEIEGMSIGDSLLNYHSKEIIKGYNFLDIPYYDKHYYSNLKQININNIIKMLPL